MLAFACLMGYTDRLDHAPMAEVVSQTWHVASPTVVAQDVNRAVARMPGMAVNVERYAAGRQAPARQSRIREPARWMLLLCALMAILYIGRRRVAANGFGG